VIPQKKKKRRMGSLQPGGAFAMIKADFYGNARGGAFFYEHGREHGEKAGVFSRSGGPEAEYAPAART